jgi:hypothetical protein
MKHSDLRPLANIERTTSSLTPERRAAHAEYVEASMRHRRSVLLLAKAESEDHPVAVRKARRTMLASADAKLFQQERHMAKYLR